MPEAIDYSSNRAVTAVQLAELFRSAGMRRPVDDLKRLDRMLKHASLTVGAFAGDQLVGVARALTDFSYCCYLSDLAVAAAFQRRGIGRELLRRVREIIGPQCNLVLLAAPDAMSYYPRLGFEAIANGWMIKRTG